MIAWSFWMLLVYRLPFVEGFDDAIASSTTIIEDATTQPPQMITPAPNHALLEKLLDGGDGLPTITIGNISSYIPSSSISYNGDDLVPVGLNLTIVDLAHFGNNESAYAVILSDDLQKRLKERMDAECNTDDTSQCLEVVHEVLHNPSVDLQPRVFGIDDALVGLAFLVGGIIIEEWRVLNRQVEYTIVIPHADVAQLTSSASFPADATEDSVVIDGLSGSPATFTDLVASITTTGLMPSISTLLTPVSGHVPGDLMLVLPTSLADRITEAVDSDNATCVEKRDWARPADLEMGCMVQTAQKLIYNAEPGGSLEGLLPLSQQDPMLFMKYDWGEYEEVIQETTLMIEESPLVPAITQLRGHYMSLAFIFVGIVLTVHVTTGLRTRNWMPFAVRNYPSVSLSTTSTESCTTTPWCGERDCSSSAEEFTCAGGAYEGCGCRMMGCTFGPNFVESQISVFHMVQQMVQTPVSASATPNPELCTPTGAPVGFYGSPLATPSAWCECERLISAPRQPQTLTLPTLTANATVDQCYFLTGVLPSPSTLEVQWASREHVITSCRLTSTVPTPWPTRTTVTYCTCNDDDIHIPSTTTLGTARPSIYCESETKTSSTPAPSTSVPPPPPLPSLPTFESLKWPPLYYRVLTTVIYFGYKIDNRPYDTTYAWMFRNGDAADWDGADPCGWWKDWQQLHMFHASSVSNGTLSAGDTNKLHTQDSLNNILDTLPPYFENILHNTFTANFSSNDADETFPCQLRWSKGDMYTGGTNANISILTCGRYLSFACTDGNWDGGSFTNNALHPPTGPRAFQQCEDDPSVLYLVTSKCNLEKRNIMPEWNWILNSSYNNVA